MHAPKSVTHAPMMSNFVMISPWLAECLPLPCWVSAVMLGEITFKNPK
jgi:hypothetical protein